MIRLRLQIISRLLVTLLFVSSCTKGSLLPASRVRTEPPSWVLDRLYFGRSIPDGGQVSEQSWRLFLTDVVTPRFPDGLTVWRVEGQWRDTTGTIVREPSYLLELAHPDQADAQRKLKEIIAEYKQRFRQESVLRITDPVEVEF
ncbi:putative lipoprotein [Fibrisoma limi BUZ 3]|uniref:Putative lipoprotein n=1 Tax=Fibrisoma limi BUZ 3 TaxID=1185876 RepID=I2GFJ9_9BACT|nr:DUF3574 domain-containing protein [Fibrisoma limi]CCH52674.1 putative lipoprotein [Fibrisoma limi BUZ 3]